MPLAHHKLIKSLKGKADESESLSLLAIDKQKKNTKSNLYLKMPSNFIFQYEQVMEWRIKADFDTLIGS